MSRPSFDEIVRSLEEEWIPKGGSVVHKKIVPGFEIVSVFPAGKVCGSYSVYTVKQHYGKKWFR